MSAKNEEVNEPWDHKKPKEPAEMPDVTGWLIYALVFGCCGFSILYTLSSAIPTAVLLLMG